MYLPRWCVVVAWGVCMCVCCCVVHLVMSLLLLLFLLLLGEGREKKISCTTCKSKHHAWNDPFRCWVSGLGLGSLDRLTQGRGRRGGSRKNVKTKRRETFDDNKAQREERGHETHPRYCTYIKRILGTLPACLKTTYTLSIPWVSRYSISPGRGSFSSRTVTPSYPIRACKRRIRPSRSIEPFAVPVVYRKHGSEIFAFPSSLVHNFVL
ncbi:hypothetical protein F4775DRAFT_534283, partial [Biscogniauxia sp. FL1348]